MILKRKSPEERFAEALARELERQAKELAKRMTQEQLRDIKVMKKNSPAVALIEKRIERGEIKLYWRNVEGELHILHCQVAGLRNKILRWFLARLGNKGRPSLRFGQVTKIISRGLDLLAFTAHFLVPLTPLLRP